MTTNAFDQAQGPSSRPGPGSGPGPGPGWDHPDRVWGYAGFWWRVLAWTIDSAILSAIAVLLHQLLGGGLGMIGVHPSPSGVLNVGYLSGAGYVSGAAADALQPTTWHFRPPGLVNLVSLLVPIGYYALLESSSWQATVGKRVCRLRVTRLDGRRITLPRALCRYLGKFVSAFILGIGFLMVAWTQRKQGLHDLMAETLVVRLRQPSDLVRFNPPG